VAENTRKPPKLLGAKRVLAQNRSKQRETTLSTKVFNAFCNLLFELQFISLYEVTRNLPKAGCS